MGLNIRFPSSCFHQRSRVSSCAGDESPVTQLCPRSNSAVMCPCSTLGVAVKTSDAFDPPLGLSYLLDWACRLVLALHFRRDSSAVIIFCMGSEGLTLIAFPLPPIRDALYRPL